MWNFLKKHKVAVFILVVLLVGIFLRAWHFSDWLHFELDQSRDAKVIDLAYTQGISNLPLLGPKAAGTFLRLGPVFYYFKYLSALVFGNTPSGIAVIIMLFGILAMPAFYFFSREYFDKKISLALLLLFSLSLFLIIYSRFSWNPNPLPLFTLLTFYCLLRATRKVEKKKGMWLIFSSVSLGITIQLHFLAFVAVPLITVIYLVITRPKIRWFYWAISALLIIFLYSPAIANDFMTGGKNLGQLMEVVSDKSSKDTQHSMAEKIIENFNQNALGYYLILSGNRSELAKINWKVTDMFTCDSVCRKYFPSGIAAVLIYLLGIILIGRKLYNHKKLEPDRKNFMILASIWLIICFGLFVPLAFKISPRFFLLTSALPFIFLGIILEFVGEKISAGKSIVVISIITALFAASNALATQKRFSEYQNAPQAAFKIEPDRILKENNRVTLQQQYMIINYIESIYKQNHFPVYLNSDSFYRRSFLFHLDKRNIPQDDFRNVTGSQKVYQNGNYFLVYPTLSNTQKDLEKYSNSFDLIDTKLFGTLTLFQLEPKKESITDIQQEFQEEKKTTGQGGGGVPKRYTWEEIFSEASGEESE